MESITFEKAAPVKRAYRYTVTGTYAFPIDMLRYDEAWPAHEFDSALIIQTTEHTSHEALKINIASYRAPTLARWESFGWKVL